jgi:peptidoglycan/xylan/chitin deacetylase (PgdA/CDA1 family)
MNYFRLISLFTLISLMGCASQKPEIAYEAHSYKTGYRTIAQVDETTGEVSQKKTAQLIKGIFHSYILGQVYLRDFDKSLDNKKIKALETETYHDLQAIRILVDEFEEQINDLYVRLVLVTALPKYSNQQKEKAQASLNLIGNFLGGMVSDTQKLSENLRPLILSNLVEKQTALYDELMALKADASITSNDPDAIKTIHNNMVLLRATRKSFNSNLMTYKVNDSLLDQTVARISQDNDFQIFKKSIKSLSKKIQHFKKEVVGRSTSSETIFPSAGAAGNITGRGFPKNTWSLTYDDGPGAKTTPQILKNLKDRNMKATFFMLAKQVEALPTISKTITSDGHDLASHSYDHAQLTKVSASELEKQIGGSKKVIEDKLGKPIKLFRLPYGAGVSNATIRAKIAQHAMVHVFWNVDTLDWQDKNPTSILNRTVKQMSASANNSGVVLFHDIHQQSVIASTMLMDHFISKGTKVCTVQEVVDQINQGKADCKN